MRQVLTRLRAERAIYMTLARESRPVTRSFHVARARAVNHILVRLRSCARLESYNAGAVSCAPHRGRAHLWPAK